MLGRGHDSFVPCWIQKMCVFLVGIVSVQMYYRYHLQGEGGAAGVASPIWTFGKGWFETATYIRALFCNSLPAYCRIACVAGGAFKGSA